VQTFNHQESFMFFAPVTRHAAFVPSYRAIDRFIDQALTPNAVKGYSVEQDDKSYAISVDLPGLPKELLVIGIEGNVVRLESKPEAKRQYKAAYELPQDIDPSASVASLVDGVLTLKLAKKVPVSNVTQLTIN
jgi:HSP20 family molecular chaperone IbpA